MQTELSELIFSMLISYSLYVGQLKVKPALYKHQNPIKKITFVSVLFEEKVQRRYNHIGTSFTIVFYIGCIYMHTSLSILSRIKNISHDITHLQIGSRLGA